MITFGVHNFYITKANIIKWKTSNNLRENIWHHKQKKKG